MPATPRLILLGPRGSGKTTLGRLVAERLGCGFVDLDAVVQDAAGKTIARIFADEGEAGFRDREADALDEVASSDAVVATGGGVVVREANRDRLRALDCPRVLLLAEPEVLHARVVADVTTAATRPALTQHSGVAELRHLLDQRLPLYREVATHDLDASETTDDLVDAIVSLARDGQSPE